jgi:hypothetical protein
MRPELEGKPMPDLSVHTTEEPGEPPVRRRLVGGALRRYREQAGYALEGAAGVPECDRSKISRIEIGQRGIRAKELRELLNEYGIGKGEQATLTAIADPRRARHGWRKDYADIVPDGYHDLMHIETQASEIWVYDPQQVPDLLQTRDYARAVAASDPGTPEPGTLDRLAEMTITRQQAILNERRTAVTVVLGEGALRQEIGPPGVMRDQVGGSRRSAAPARRLPSRSCRSAPRHTPRAPGRRRSCGSRRHPASAWCTCPD